MWYLWPAVLLVSRVLVSAAEGGEGAAAPAPEPATTRAPPRRTLDRQAAEQAWRTWLQSPESGNQNAPPRRITTKSLFITPLVCPKGQRLDRNGCVQVLTVGKEEHENILLEQLNALFAPSATSADVVYDYGDDERGPLQLSLPISWDPQAAALQAQEPTGQAHELQPNYIKVDKKEENTPDNDAGIVAELELLKLPHSQLSHNDTVIPDNADILNHNVLSNVLPLEKPKRDSPVVNSTKIETINNTDQGQKEVVYGHVNVDPVLYDTSIQSNTETEKPIEPIPAPITSTLAIINDKPVENTNKTTPTTDNVNTTMMIVTNSTHVLKNDGDKTKLNPENDYVDIGEAIKLISRYAEVTTDDNFAKDQKKNAMKDDSILGTRTKLQHRRNKLKLDTDQTLSSAQVSSAAELSSKNNVPFQGIYPKNEGFYRYPWLGQHSPTPPPDYPFRHLQDYWPGQSHVGGVYNAAHENPRRHHHTIPHNYFKPHGLPFAGYAGPYPNLQEAYHRQMQGYPHRAAPRHIGPMLSHSNNQDFYSLLGLRHWFSSEGTSKR